MASDFEYTGVANHQAGFRDKTTGSITWLRMEQDDRRVELLDGDEVIIDSAYSRDVWSIREQRIIRTA